MREVLKTFFRIGRFKMAQQLILERQAIEDKNEIVSKWLWLDNYNKWRHCSEEVSQKINALPLNQSISITINKRSYRMSKTDSNTATQTNTRSNKVRPVKRIEQKYHKKDSIICWCWMDNHQVWRAFEDFISTQIESMAFNSTMDITIKGRKYQILKKKTINDACQYNVKTKRERALKRVVKYCQQKPVWQWQGDNGKVWTDLPLTTSIDIDNLGIGESFTYRVRHKSFIVVKTSDTRCEQTRTTNKKKRMLRRVSSNVHDYPTPSMEKDDVKDSHTNDHDEQDNETLNECVVCMDNEKQYVCVPCGHLCLCLDCSRIINGKCPMCRSECQVMKVFK
eukprot:29868_1